jgi:hypothetical protein
LCLIGEWGEAQIADPWGVEMLGKSQAI